jgi:long-chain fatty acid transport protein
MKRKVGIAILLTCLLHPSGLMSNGLSLNSVGVKALGMSGAYVGLADDYSAIYWNPGGLTQLSSPQISIFAMDVVPLGTYAVAFPPPGSGATIDAKAKVKHHVIPGLTGYLPAYQEGNLVVGIGVYVPAGHGVEWHGEDLTPFSGPAGTVYQWKSEISAVNFSPALAYRFSPEISVGAAFSIYYARMEMERPMDMYDEGAQEPGQDGIVDTQYKESGSGFGFGGALGVLVNPSDKVRLGLTFRSKTTVSFDGKAENEAFETLVAPNSDYEREV